MKDLLVTLADKNFIEQAKQLFSSAYFNGGWKGDYMLLAHNVPEKKLKWFRDKGILVKICKSLHNKNVGQLPPTTLSKFYLFTPEFKNWGTIVFLDADIMVECPLDHLTKIKGFAAVQDSPRKLSYQFATNVSKQSQLKKDYDLNSSSFNSGVFAFSSDIIKKDTYDKMVSLFDKYKDVSLFGEQGVINLGFYRKWEPLPQMFNINVYQTTGCFLFRRKVEGVLHFIGKKKPWQELNPYFDEWDNNLKKSDLIDIKRPVKVTNWNEEQVLKYSRYLERKRTLYYPIVTLDRLIGKIGRLWR